MKIFLSVDIEGITGTTHWNDTISKEREYAEFREQMTAEAAAVCEGLLEGGAEEIVVKDAHGNARNIIGSKLPEGTRLSRGWSGHPYSMMDGLDDSFAAVCMVGYHSAAGSDSNPLSHTMSPEVVRLEMNGAPVSEFLLNTYTSMLAGVPVILVSGDAGICSTAREILPGAATVAVKEGKGNSTISIHPGLAVEKLKSAAVNAVVNGIDRNGCLVSLPSSFEMRVTYRSHSDAYMNSHYPGASLYDPITVVFSARDYFEVLRFMLFTV